MKREWKGIAILMIFFLICMGGSFYISRYKLVIYPIHGDSMEPTIHDRDKTLVWRTQNIKHGDIVILESKAYNTRLIKRVIGLGGDVIEIKYNSEKEKYNIWRNNQLLKEEYILEDMVSPSYSPAKIVIPKGQFYYLGDNRNWSKDSHSEGVVEDISLIVGKVIMRYKGFDIGFKLAISA